MDGVGGWAVKTGAVQSMPVIDILEDAQAIADKVAGQVSLLAQESIRQKERFDLVLSGGSTPRLLYERLCSHPYVDALPWNKIFFYFGDERCVPPDHPDSNYCMAHESLFAKINIPSINIFRMPGEMSPNEGAQQYERILRNRFPGQSYPKFDLILLGLGDDGHTASLFPDAAILKEEKAWVSATPHTTPPPPLVSRLSLTLPAINAAEQVFFLVSGQAKQIIVSKALFAGAKSSLLPAQMINPQSRKLTWFLDRSAAGSI